MNWARGLFRLWLLVSALWVAGWGVVMFDRGNFSPNKTFEIEGPNKEKYEVIAPATTTEAGALAFVQANKRADCSQNSGPWCIYPVKLKMPEDPIDSAAVYAAIGVPTAVFLLGAALFWAISGFRQRA